MVRERARATNTCMLETNANKTHKHAFVPRRKGGERAEKRRERARATNTCMSETNAKLFVLLLTPF